MDKKIELSHGSQARFVALQNLKTDALRQVEVALSAADNAVREAVKAGAALLQVKESLEHGEFEAWCDKAVPVSQRTIRVWMQLCTEVPSQALRGDDRFQLGAGGVIEVEGQSVTVDMLLTAPEEELTDAQREGRQLLMDFTANKTIRQCLAGIVVEGDEPHRLKRAANGRNARQTRGEDRKDWPLFALNKLKDLDAHLSHWDSMTESQRTELKAVVRAAVIGDSVTLAKRPGATRTFEAWPKELIMVLSETCRELLR